MLATSPTLLRATTIGSAPVVLGVTRSVRPITVPGSASQWTDVFGSTTATPASTSAADHASARAPMIRHFAGSSTLEYSSSSGDRSGVGRPRESAPRPVIANAASTAASSSNTATTSRSCPPEHRPYSRVQRGEPADPDATLWDIRRHIRIPDRARVRCAPLAISERGGHLCRCRKEGRPRGRRGRRTGRSVPTRSSAAIGRQR